MADGIEQALSKIRPHTSSSLAHQKAPAVLLQALEATFREQNTDRTPTAYFAALLTTLDSTLQTARASGPSFGEGDVLPAELYLLALVIPYVAHPVIRSNLNTILSLTAPLFPALVPHAPPLRSQLTIYATVLHALEKPQLETPGLRQAFGSLLHLCLDPRPKVRKKAAELVKDVLSSPPPPLIRHPYADRVAEWTISSLGELTEGGIPKFKGKKAETDGTDTAIHLLTFLRPVLPMLPSSSLPTITASLLTLPRLGNPYLSQSSYSILADLLAVPVDDPVNNLQGQLQDILQAVLSDPPSNTDMTLAPAWASVVGHAMLAFRSSDPDACVAKVGDVWKALWSFLDSDQRAIRQSTSDALDSLVKCFTPEMIQSAVKDKTGTKATLRKLITLVDKALGSLSYANATPEILSVLSSLIAGLRYRTGPSHSPTAAELLLMPLIVKVANLRIQKTFEYKEAADLVCSTAMRIMGPGVLLRELPLNLEPADRQAGKEPRAFLLPMLSQPHPSPLSHFVSYFVPLTERMFDLQQNAESEGRQSEAKVWSVLVHQIWSGLHGYCYGATDLRKTLTPQLSQMLSQLLYSQPDLRPAVLKALKVLAETNVAIASGDPVELAKLPETVRVDPVPRELAADNLTFLRTQVESWLAVLFNVFSTIGRDGQQLVADVISAWASIAEEKEVANAYRKLIDLLKQNLAKTTTSHAASSTPEQSSLTAMTLDLIILTLPYLSSTDATSLFNLCLTTEILEAKDNAVQKRGYKILGKLIESSKVQVDTQSVLQQLDKLLDGMSSAAKKDRFVLLTLLLNQIPSSNLHIIPSIIPEAVLGTKEPSEKARMAAFDLIVAMGKKMSEGGIVKRNLVDGMDDSEDDPSEALASVEEYLTMVAGGLAGATPHMISATVTAISRLVFEFRDSISPSMHTEIFTTLLVFVSSSNREIVKSSLGYVKLAIHTMPVDLLRPHLKQLVSALLSWSHDHKNHFKEKVRHIFERMLRRFGWEDVYSCAAEEEARKVLLNIKKRKDRAKRKRAREAEDEDEDEDVPDKGKPTGDAFEDVLYGSESELDDSDDEDGGRGNPSATKRKGTTGGARLRADNDEPMDLLSGAASRITSDKSKHRRKPGQDAARFKTDDSGKIVIDASGDGDDVSMEEDVAGVAYRETLTSVDGFTRGPNGRVKFNKDTKKRRREADEADDIEMADADQSAGRKAEKRRSEPKLGREFKAKKAGGDVKKGGVEPYAYLPLSQAAKKKGRRERIGVAGKR
ncbi:hypothetical protein NM688_g5502 [Phlebia brevispora]|uniref:Uncharacterized protein n=1 Tax=Phlebia brevispora TaxID=194682 RepID=A0ACC1SUJ9_9APHY|nr:hypothetical protein NM688_g5502 [Phlebia brevispora]